MPIFRWFSGTLPSLGRMAMSQRSIGKPAPCTRSFNYRRPAGISRLSYSLCVRFEPGLMLYFNRFLHDHSHYAVAQKKYVFIYDRDGVELHRLKSHIEPTRLEFLPYHWLLASVVSTSSTPAALLYNSQPSQGMSGFLKYQDTSTGQVVVEHRTKLGACTTMTQNVHNAVIHLGHQNGTVTLWTPNLSHPAVRLLAHLGPVTGVSVDPSTGGRYMATSGQDGTVKVWDCRNWRGSVREWSTRGGGAEIEWSQKGALAVAVGGSVNVSGMFSCLQSLLKVFLKFCPGIRKTGDTDTLHRSCTSPIVHDPSYPPSAVDICPLLSLPRCSHHRSQLRSVQHPCPWLGRAKL